MPILVWTVVKDLWAPASLSYGERAVATSSRVCCANTHRWGVCVAGQHLLLLGRWDTLTAICVQRAPLLPGKKMKCHCHISQNHFCECLQDFLEQFDHISLFILLKWLQSWTIYSWKAQRPAKRLLYVGAPLMFHIPLLHYGCNKINNTFFFSPSTTPPWLLWSHPACKRWRPYAKALLIITHFLGAWPFPPRHEQTHKQKRMSACQTSGCRDAACPNTPSPPSWQPIDLFPLMSSVFICCSSPW